MPLRQPYIKAKAAESGVGLLSAAVSTDMAQCTAWEMAQGITANLNGCKNKICIILWLYYIGFLSEIFVQANYNAHS